MDASSRSVTIIQPRQNGVRLGFGELWEFRELLWVLATREIKIRYKQTFLGAGWAVLQPFAAMIVFSVIFGKLAKIPSDGIPYPIFAYAALVPWFYFSRALSGAAGSIVEHRPVITKVYFPRLLLPIAPLISGLLDFFIAMLVLIGMMAWFKIIPTVAIVALPALILLAMLTALAVGLWLSALSAHFRDFRYMIPFMIQLWLWATPIVYPSSLIPDQWRALYGLNPMAGVVEGFRWALLGVDTSPGPMIWVSVSVVLLLLFSGLIFFRRMERTFVDVV